MPTQLKDINLLPKDKWTEGVIGKLLKWVLNVGRYLVVFTELIVILAFLYRFRLDQQLTDLDEEIKQKQTTITSYGDLEKKFRRLQLQLKTSKQVNSQRLPIETILTTISQITPLDAVYRNINISPDKIFLEGQVFSEAGLATLLAKAQINPLFTEVVLENVSSATDKTQAIDFRMALSLTLDSSGKDKN